MMSTPLTSPASDVHSPTEDEQALRRPGQPDSDPGATPEPAAMMEERTFGGLHSHRDPSLAGPDAIASDEGLADTRRRIEWVRPTDLFARLSARASERGVEWNERAHEWAREQSGAGLSDARTRVGRIAQTMGARLSRTGPAPVVHDPVRL